MINKIFNEDCLVGMQRIPDKSIDCIICDLPYGTTACKWDTIIPFDPLWVQYKRIIKDNGAIVLFGIEPFSSALRMSNLKMYKYDWVWNKSKSNGFFNVKKMPLKNIECISVFYNKQCNYNPQGIKKCNKLIKTRIGAKNKSHISAHNGGAIKVDYFEQTAENYPNQSLYFKKPNKTLHPTQKPEKLIEYLIKTYSNENEVILDNCMGSGTTAIAAINTNRKYIGFEMDKTYFDIAKNRVEEAKTLFS